MEVPILRNLLQQKQQEVNRLMTDRLTARSPMPASRCGVCCKKALPIVVLVLLVVVVVLVATFATQPAIAFQVNYWLVKSGIYSTVSTAGKIEF